MIVVRQDGRVTVLLDVRRDARERWGRILRLPLRNPIAASAAGVSVAATGWRLPAEVTAPAQMLGGASVPAALFALGMSLNARTERPDAVCRAERRLLVALKIAVRPLLGSRSRVLLLGTRAAACVLVNREGWLTVRSFLRAWIWTAPARTGIG